MTKLVKVTCELRYIERMKLLSGYENIYKDLLRKEPEDAARWLTPGLRLDDQERKQIMVVDTMRSIIDVEQSPNVGFCKDSILQFFKRLESEFGIPQVDRWGLRSTWVQEYNGEFKQLLALCKQHIFGNSSLAEKVDDVGAVFDYHIDDGKKLTLTIGPMQLNQLKIQFLTFKTESIAPVFLYVDVDMGDTVTKQYSVKYLHEFFDRAMQEGERLVTEVVKQVGLESGHR